MDRRLASVSRGEDLEDDDSLYTDSVLRYITGKKESLLHKHAGKILFYSILRFSEKASHTFTF